MTWQHKKENPHKKTAGLQQRHKTSIRYVHNLEKTKVGLNDYTVQPRDPIEFNFSSDSQELHVCDVLRAQAILSWVSARVNTNT